jgi:hypothetical protein
MLHRFLGHANRQSFCAVLFNAHQPPASGDLDTKNCMIYLYKSTSSEERDYELSPAAFSRASKFGEPSPVAGSQPAMAGKPSEPQPALFPKVTSLSACGFAYSQGFKNPS